jgi:RNA polymerase sigma-70 factor (ECF subfamily)
MNPRSARVFIVGQANGGGMESLSHRLASGDASAFAELYEACADRLHHYLTVRLGSIEDASDALQETFLRLARRAKKFADISDPISYAFVAARNEAARLSKKRTRRTQRQVARAEMLFVESASNDLTIRETAEAISSALAELDAGLREIIELKVYGGLTFAEIAAVTCLPQGTVATRYRTGIGRLRRLFAEESL